MESCEWDEHDVCSFVVKYVCVESLDLDSEWRYMDSIRGKVWGFYKGYDEP